MTLINNKKELESTRKTLRNNQTKGEQLIWSKLKGKQVLGLKFRRQHSVGRYILDFYCPEKKLAIEIDGDNHFEKSQKKYDNIRTEFLKEPLKNNPSPSATLWVLP